MNRKLLFVLPLSWMMVGCVAIKSIDCPPYTGPIKECSEKQNPQAPMVTLNTNSMHATPECVRAEKGSTLIFRITPKANLELGAVEIIPKNKDDTWLAAKNDDYEDLIIIPVPNNISLGEHKYGFKAGDKCVDPRVSVE